MEELSVQEAAGSPRAQFPSLETQPEGLSPEPEFLQDADMEQGLPGGVCDIRGCGCAPYSRGMGMPGPCSEGSLQRSDVRELWERGLTGHTSPSSHHPDS
uniref:Zinc finger protein 655 n=1 Tax=Myotis myotis TaxID=51298 RepID=A0A7J7Y3C2_MYOMY|nr:zinc finger protein 655 [Myotis myotis]